MGRDMDPAKIPIHFMASEFDSKEHQWNCNWNAIVFMQENATENTVYKMLTILDQFYY